jgi:hypothetical protein
MIDEATLLAERLSWGWLGAAHLLVPLGTEDWGAAPRILGEMGATASALRSALNAAASIPPEPSDEPRIYWWDSHVSEVQ